MALAHYKWLIIGLQVEEGEEGEGQDATLTTSQGRACCEPGLSMTVRCEIARKRVPREASLDRLGTP
jgi:hypothetical protein